MFYSAVCFSTGFFVSALGAHLHSLWLTGLAIMGFGGGAMIGGPLANNLMTFFKAQGQTAPIPATFLVMGALYFVFMMHGVFTIRVPMQTTLQPAAVVQPEVTTLETPKN